MASLKSHVGMRSGVYRDKITPERISAFCSAIGLSKVSTNVEGTFVAPPTFMTVFRKGEFDLFQQLGIDLASILHAQQEYQYERSICSGDAILFETTLSNVLEKKGSSSQLQFITVETHVQAETASGVQSVGRSTTSVVVRNKLPEEKTAGVQSGS